MRKIRTAKDNPDFQIELEQWVRDIIDDQIRPSADKKAAQLAEEWDVDADLVTAALFRTLQNHARTLTGWVCAEARYNKSTLQEISDACGFASPSHIKRSWPNFDEIVKTIEKVEETGEGHSITIAGIGWHILPSKENTD